MEKHRNAFSIGQSFVQMNTVADGLASLSFHHGKRKGEEKERKAVETEEKGEGKETEFNNSRVQSE